MSNPLIRQNVSIDKMKNLNWISRVGIHKGFTKTIKYFL